MKTLLKVSLFFCLVTSLYYKGQTVVNMAGNNNNYPSDYLSNGQYYIKDVNNYLDNFTGTWEYSNGNEKFQIILKKLVKFHRVTPINNYNYYEDGINIVYKKISNGNLIFESPAIEKPYFDTKNGVILDGYITDYDRIAKKIILPKINKVLYPGGYPMQPNCTIELLPTTLNASKKIKFHLFYRHEGMTGYDYETYAGRPTFSVPNDIIMTKVE